MYDAQHNPGLPDPTRFPWRLEFERFQGTQTQTQILAQVHPLPPSVVHRHTQQTQTQPHRYTDTQRDTDTNTPPPRHMWTHITDPRRHHPPRHARIHTRHRHRYIPYRAHRRKQRHPDPEIHTHHTDTQIHSHRRPQRRHTNTDPQMYTDIHSQTSTVRRHRDRYPGSQRSLGVFPVLFPTTREIPSAGSGQVVGGRSRGRPGPWSKSRKWGSKDEGERCPGSLRVKGCVGSGPRGDVGDGSHGSGGDGLYKFRTEMTGRRSFERGYDKVTVYNGRRLGKPSPRLSQTERLLGVRRFVPDGVTSLRVRDKDGESRVGVTGRTSRAGGPR